MYGLRWNEKAARKAAWEDGRIEGEAKGIAAAVAMAKDLSANQSQVIEQLMKRFDLTREQASDAVQTNW